MDSGRSNARLIWVLLSAFEWMSHSLQFLRHVGFELVTILLKSGLNCENRQVQFIRVKAGGSSITEVNFPQLLAEDQFGISDYLDNLVIVEGNVCSLCM